jgi:hypothetical protein
LTLSPTVGAAIGSGGRTMPASKHWVVVGLDNGGASNNATVRDAHGHFLVDRLVENASFVQEGPAVALDALASALDNVLELTGTPRSAVPAVGLDTPGPTSADGVVSSKGEGGHPGRAEGHPAARHHEAGYGQTGRGRAGKANKIINAEGESLAASALGDASYVMMAHPLALQLRNLQSPVEIGVDKNTTVVFPAPLMRHHR